MHATTSTLVENETQRRELRTPAPAFYVCPKCTASLAAASRSLGCDACRRLYLLCNHIPDFFREDLHLSANWSLRHSRWFDWLAPIYETNLGYPMVMRLAGVKGVASLPELLLTVKEMTRTVSGDVLDVACGPGTSGRRLAAHSRTVFGADISFGMLERGCAYARRVQVTNVRFARARAESLPFSRDAFAAALCCGSLHLFGDTRLALREIARTLKPGAVFVGVTFTATDTRFSRFAHRHGARLIEVKDLGDLLRETGLEDYRPRTSGSALVFSARKNDTAADSLFGWLNITNGAAQ
jgi:SAM-dependent methyltransferase